MEKITLPKASKLTSPNPLTLVCTQKPSGETNLATVSWWTYLSYNPGIIGFAMAKTSYSGELTRETKQVVLAMPGAEIAEQVMSCGTVTGRDTSKAEKFGVKLTELPGSSIQVPLQSRVAIFCELTQTVDVGDHYLYICNVNDVYGDESQEALLAWNGYAKLRPAQMK